MSAARLSIPALGPLVALSGLTGLVYQSLWLRSFGLVFGNTTDAVALTLAVFMGGLAAGGALAARRAAAVPLRAYAQVELLIAGAALLTLPLLRWLPRLYGVFAARVELFAAADVSLRGIAAGLVVLPATLLMGMTVPLAAEALARRGSPLGASFPKLYLANTLGGALGVALVPLALLPGLGMAGTLVFAALVNAAIGLTALRWSRDDADRRAEADSAAEQASASQNAATRDTARRDAASHDAMSHDAVHVMPLGAIHALAAASGAFAFGIEILWTRSFALVLGSSVHSFSGMLLAVLVGIAGGSVLAARLPCRSRTPALLAVLFLIAGLGAILGAITVGRLPAVFFALMRALPVSFVAHQTAGFVLCLAVLLPVTAALGVSFPLLVSCAERHGGSAQGTTGRVYAWNTAGAIAGALVADFVLVDRLGIQGSYLPLAALPLGAGFAALAWARGSSPLLRLALPALVVLVLAAAAPRFRPWDPLLMSAGVYKYGLEWRERPGYQLGRDLAADRRLLFYREGREAVVAVSERPASNRRFLSVNGKTDAGSGAQDVLTQKFIAHVPLLLHPSPRQALVIGWGAGATAASAALHPLERIECVEIEPATYAAADFFEELSGGVRRDPRFRIVFRDGRNHLLRSASRWDVIVSEPSNPWISGVSNLFTREFYEIARGRLAKHGVFGQWFHYYNLDAADVRVELATFASVFPHVTLWLVPPIGGRHGTLAADLLLVGSDEPQRLDWDRLVSVFASRVGDDLRSTGVLPDPAALAAAFAMDGATLRRFVQDRAAFPRGTPLNTDDQPWLELRAPLRNIVPPAEVAAAARALYAALAEAGTGLEPPLAGAGAKGAIPAKLWVDLGARYAEMAQPTRALEALRRAVALDAANAHVQLQLAEHLIEAGRADEAEPVLREVVRLDANAVRPLELLGGLYLDRRDFVRAEDAHRTLLRLRPADVSAWLRLGAVLARQSKWTEARDALHEARRLDPTAPIDASLLAHVEGRAAAAAGRP